LETQELRIKISEMLVQALIEGLHVLKKKENIIKEKKKWSFGSEYDNYKFGNIGRFESGVVNFSSSRKFKYQTVINLEEDVSKLQTWTQYHNFVINSDFFREYYNFSRFNDYAKELNIISHITTYEIQKILGSYIYLNNVDFSIDRELIDKLVEEFVNRIFIEYIDYSIWIPIVFTNFELDFYQLSENIFIKRIPKEIHIARNANLNNSTTSQDLQLVIQGCSHALQFKGFQSLNLNYDSLNLDFFNKMNSKEFQSILDKVLGGFKILTDESLSYYQIFASSENCVLSRYAELEGISTCRYVKNKFNENLLDRGWLEVPYKIKINELENVKKMLEMLSQANYLELEFAIKKLIDGSLRNREEDAIIDATVGLESLLTDKKSKSEINYKLSIRGGFITKLSPFFDLKPSEIRDALKRIYSYRSIIVHGGKEKDRLNKRSLKLRDKDYLCKVIAFQILRHCLKFFIENPKFKELNKLDEEILNT